MKISSELEM